MQKKNLKTIIDSRHLKILTVKKDELKDAIAFIFLDDDKSGHYDVAQLRNLGEVLEKIEPNCCYFLGTKKLRVNIYDKAEFKNKDIIITVSHLPENDDFSEIDISEVEASFIQAFEESRSIKFVHNFAENIKIKK